MQKFSTLLFPKEEKKGLKALFSCSQEMILTRYSVITQRRNRRGKKHAYSLPLFQCPCWPVSRCRRWPPWPWARQAGAGPQQSLRDNSSSWLGAGRGRAWLCPPLREPSPCTRSWPFRKLGGGQAADRPCSSISCSSSRPPPPPSPLSPPWQLLLPSPRSRREAAPLLPSLCDRGVDSPVV